MERFTSLVINGGIATLTLKRPGVLNAINEPMLKNLNEDLNSINQNTDIQVLLIKGEGRAFCAGADTNVFIKKNEVESKQFLNAIVSLFKRIEDLEIPVIGVINGYAFGGGAQLAIVCDIRIATKSSSFRFPGASYGLVISGYSLPMIVGVPKAKELLFSSKIIPAEEALKIGLVNEVTLEGEENRVALELAEMICQNPNHVVRQIKRVINKGVGQTFDERFNIEMDANNKLVAEENFKDTFTSFSLNRKS